jgi:IS5 family transposase
MRPRWPEDGGSADLFRARLSNQLDLKHPLVRLAGLIDWGRFETTFGSLYHETTGRPGKPTRLMVGLTYLKHTYNLSDEAVCARWVENPYWQFFCGFDYLQHCLPIDPSSLTRWRERIGASGMEQLLAATVAAALAAGAAKPASLERVTIDTTVQPKAIAHPLDSRLYNRGREILVRLATKHGLRLRQSYHRLAKRALRLASRYAHARQMRRARREIRRLKTFLGRVARDVGRKLADHPDVAGHFAQPLALVARLLAQVRSDRSKLYALHAPEVECLAKGKAHKRYEFGVKSLPPRRRGSQSPPPTAKDSSSACWRCPVIPTTPTPWRRLSRRSSASPAPPSPAATSIAAIAAITSPTAASSSPVSAAASPQPSSASSNGAARSSR